MTRDTSFVKNWDDPKSSTEVSCNAHARVIGAFQNIGKSHHSLVFQVICGIRVENKPATKVLLCMYIYIYISYIHIQYIYIYGYIYIIWIYIYIYTVYTYVIMYCQIPDLSLRVSSLSGHLFPAMEDAHMNPLSMVPGSFWILDSLENWCKK